MHQDPFPLCSVREFLFAIVHIYRASQRPTAHHLSNNNPQQQIPKLTLPPTLKHTMLFTTQPSALRLLTSCDAADPVDDVLYALTNTSNPNRRRLRKPRVVEPEFTYTTADSEGVLEIDLPGVSRDDLAVEVQGRRLTVTGKRFRGGGDVEDEKRKKVKLAAKMKKGDDVPAETVQKPAEDVAKSVNDVDQDNAEKKDAAWNVKDQSGNGQIVPEKNGTAPKEGSGDATAAEEESDTNETRQASAVYKGVFRLHPKIDTERIALAQHSDGVLQLRMPYREKAMARKIPIA